MIARQSGRLLTQDLLAFGTNTAQSTKCVPNLIRITRICTESPRLIRLRAGDRVRHHVFGEGQVVGVEPQGEDQVVTVQFAGVGKKRLSAKLARLERV